MIHYINWVLRIPGAFGAMLLVILLTNHTLILYPAAEAISIRAFRLTERCSSFVVFTWDMITTFPRSFQRNFYLLQKIIFRPAIHPSEVVVRERRPH